MQQSRKSGLISINILRGIILAATSILAAGIMMFTVAIRPSAFPVKAGDVANQDIQAPYALSYPSDVLTEQARIEAEDAISPIYLPADPGIARREIERLRITLDYINTMRADAYGSESQKLDDLAALEDIKLQTESARAILNLTEARWQVIQQEALSVLEQIMRNTIRDYQVTDAQHNIPTLINLNLPQEQASIVSELVTAYVVPNSLFSEEQTKKARQDARNKVQPVVRTFATGEIIVRNGQIITPLAWEVLQKFGLIQPKDDNQSYIAAAALVALMSFFVSIFFFRRRSSPFNDIRGLLLISIIFLVFLYGARLIIPNRTVIPYLFPIPAFGLTIASLYSLELGMVTSLVLSILSGYGLTNSLDLTLFYTISSLCGVLALGKGRRVANFAWSGIAVGLAGSAIILAYRLPNTYTDWVGIVTLVGSALINGVASASLTLLFQFLFSQLLGITTALQLLDILRSDHPLLHYMLRNAPGTYQHSLQVSNLAEQAAESIGADGLLTRVGAIFHDAGKAANASFFIENQVPGKINPHTDIDPIVSAQTIIRHVEDGVQLAQKFRLPARIQDFMREHHGTLLARYQYAQAVKGANDRHDLVDENQFRYPGPRPQSRETALLMLADGCEARARAELPKDETELRALVKKVIEFCQHEGQLDDTTLTLKDLSTVAESFVSTLRNIYHPRIQYPEIRPAPGSQEAAPTTPISSSRKSSND